jgi:glutamine amidotransferase
MCRLVAYAGPPLAVDRTLFAGSHSLLRQSWAPRELLSGSVNVDGFGVAWYPPGRAHPLRFARTEPAWYDPEVEPLLAAQEASVAVAALRNATPGLPVERSGLLPMTLEGWAFTLNGFVPDFRSLHMRALRRPLPDELYARLTGVSDAETLFLRVVAEMRAGREPEDALARVVQAVADRIPPRISAPLTLVLSGADGHRILHTNAGDGPCNSLYLARAPEAIGTGVVLASEPLDQGSGWDPVAPHSAVTIAADGDITRSDPGRRAPDRDHVG